MPCIPFEMQSWRLASYDVGGNLDDGYDVNAEYTIVSRTIPVPLVWTGVEYPTESQLTEAFGLLPCEMDWFDQDRVELKNPETGIPLGYIAREET